MKQISNNKIILFLIYFTIIYIICDLIFGKIFNEGVAYMCRDQYLHHKYCPSSKRTYIMAKIDGGKKIESYWNKSSIRVKNKKFLNSRTNFNDFEIILIGDSFIAQRQLNFNDRISSLINLNLKNNIANQIGTGSWSPMNYLQAIRLINPMKKQKIHIFFYSNDFYSYGYGMSVSSYYDRIIEKNLSNISWKNSESYKSKFNRWFLNNSYTKQFLWKNKKANKIIEKEKKKLIKLNIDDVSNDCKKLEKIKKKLNSDRAKSLVEHSFTSNCFSNKLIRNIKLTKDITDQIENIKQELNLDVYYYLIPSSAYSSREGYSFKENYGFHRTSRLTNKGLYFALENALNLDIVNLEDVFLKHPNKNNKYFHLDGHWNELGSSIVKDIVLSKMKKISM